MKERISYDKTHNILLLFLFSIFIILRLPNVLLHGRLAGEDAAVFFAYSWHFPIWQSIWRPFAGYLNLGANVFTLLDVRLVKAGWISLENAPYVTIAIAFFFQIQAAIIILWGKASWGCNKYLKPALLFVLAFCPFSEEVWLNVMHIQYQLIICCGLILATDTPKVFFVWVYQALILIFAPLCGPGAIGLGPLFLLRSIIDKSVNRFYQTLFLGFGSIIQLFLFFSPSVVRGHFVDPLTFFSIIFVRTGIYPFLGSSISKKISQYVVELYYSGGFLWCLFSTISIFYFIFLLYMAWYYRKTPASWLLLSGLSLAVISFGGGMISTDANSWFNAKNGERYNFIPLAFFEMFLLLIIGNVSKKYRVFLRLLCTLMLLVGVSSYFKPIPIISSGPDWKRQVQSWRHDHMYSLEIWGWPKSWTMNISDINISCPVVSLKAASYKDPTYCETNWIAHVLALPHDK